MHPRRPDAERTSYPSPGTCKLSACYPQKSCRVQQKWKRKTRTNTRNPNTLARRLRPVGAGRPREGREHVGLEWQEGDSRLTSHGRVRSVYGRCCWLRYVGESARQTDMRRWEIKAFRIHRGERQKKKSSGRLNFLSRFPMRGMSSETPAARKSPCCTTVVKRALEGIRRLIARFLFRLSIKFVWRIISERRQNCRWDREKISDVGAKTPSDGQSKELSRVRALERKWQFSESINDSRHQPPQRKGQRTRRCRDEGGKLQLPRKKERDRIRY